MNSSTSCAIKHSEVAKLDSVRVKGPAGAQDKLRVRPQASVLMPIIIMCSCVRGARSFYGLFPENNEKNQNKNKLT